MPSSEDTAYPVYLLSSRPAVIDALSRELDRLDPRPHVVSQGAPGAPEQVQDSPAPEARAPLAFVDLADSRRGALPRPVADSGIPIRRVALVEGSRADRLIDALSVGFDDYLFIPINPAELRLAWKRHLGAEDGLGLALEVDDDCLCLVCPSDVAYLRPAVDRMIAACCRLVELTDDAAFRLRVAVGEAVANAILHGNKEDPRLEVTIRAEVKPGSLIVAVADEGPGFIPADVPDPTAPANLKRSTGRGLHLLRTLVDDVTYSSSGNEVRLELRIGPGPDAGEALVAPRPSGEPRPGVGRPSITVEEHLAPLLDQYQGLTGLHARLIVRRGGEESVLHDSLAGRASGLRRREIDLGGGCSVELFCPEDAPPSAATFLTDWVGHFLRYDTRNADLVAEVLKRERVMTEVELARDLQRKLLPNLEGWSDLADVAGRCEPTYFVGGDFYQLIRLGGGRLGVMLGDVSSHGISAALIMALTMSAASIFARERETPADVLFGIHDALLRELESTEMYMTLFYSVLDPAAGCLRYANAGHAYAYRLTGGIPKRLEALDPPVGITAPDAYREGEASWNPGGDLLVLMTDGLADSVAQGAPEGDAMLRGLAEDSGADPGALVRALFEASGEEARPDDRTALVVRSAAVTTRN